MNRYAFLFALMVVASFAVPTPQSGGRNRSAADQGKDVAANPPMSHDLKEAENFIAAFENKGASDRGTAPSKQTQSGAAPHIQVLFATVPHPLETHLAAQFDHNVDALQDGLQDSGFVFDSSWIPWRAHSAAESFDDEQKEKKAQDEEDKLPGVLLFRKACASQNAYDYGLVAFLITDKPTQGVALAQVTSSLQIIEDLKLNLSPQIRILGPTFSGSFPSLVVMVKKLAGNHEKVTHFLIRSGAVTVGDYAWRAARQMASNGANVDFGSVQYAIQAWRDAAIGKFEEMGIRKSQIALLSESESVFGGAPAQNEAQPAANGGKADSKESQPWKVYFPRDISSLRAEYEKQGIFDVFTAQQPWKRTLSLTSEKTTQRDTVRSFGGAETDAAQESVLIGISEFLALHGIRAVLISATNEEDRYFLTQFIHARNSDIRVAIMGATRLFLRGSTAQFRGDIMVGDFPMLPLLRDWTAGSDSKGSAGDSDARVFPDDSSQGTYFAALDLMAAPPAPSVDPSCGRTSYADGWVPEYSTPNWPGRPGQAGSVRRPPMYLAALGGNAAWPVAEKSPEPWPPEEATGKNRTEPGSCPRCNWRVQMPFTMSGRDPSNTSDGAKLSPKIQASTSWIALFLVLAVLALGYCICFWYADTARHRTCASFEPLPDWRHWFCTAIVPGLVFACAFQVMAIGVDLSRAASTSAHRCWLCAEAMTIAAPLAIAVCALWRAQRLESVDQDKTAKSVFLPNRWWRIVLFAPCVLAARIAVSLHPMQPAKVGAILNTYREMHWESGLSLVPTALIFLLAILVWSYQAGQGLTILAVAPALPHIDENDKISDSRSQYMATLGRPLTSADNTRGLWAIWMTAVAVLFCLQFGFRPFREITTLEAQSTTYLLLGVGCVIAALILLDLLQFVWLWNRLTGTLRSLSRKPFKRSFVPVQDFTWRALWSFGGVSMRDRRLIEALQSDCVLELADQPGFGALKETAKGLREMRDRYNKVPIMVDAKQHAKDRAKFREWMVEAGTDVYGWIRKSAARAGDSQASTEIQPITIGNADKDDRFSEERAEVARLPQMQRTAERFLCLLYIGFILTFVARLHSLLISVAMMFSLAAVGVAIYPFVPVAPLVSAGLLLLALISTAFFKVFSGLDTDPIMARIVNGDDRKLQWSFYGKFVGSMALPLLTLASTLLPGGTSHLLDLARVLLSHGQ
jgi:hypothetical protein